MKLTQLKVIYKENLLSPEIGSSRDVFAFLMAIWDCQLINLQEQVYILYLNNASRVIAWRLLNTGNSNKCLFDIKLAVACGLNTMAAKIVVAHNHPGAILKPSNEDLQITHKLYWAAKLIDIDLIDHLIVSSNDYYSFMDHDQVP